MSSKKEKSTIMTLGPGSSVVPLSVEGIKNVYICEGASAQELSERFSVPVAVIDKIIADNKLQDLRAAHIKHGLAKLQNMQVVQAEKLMDMETKFKKMRILQLEKTLEDYLAYYSKHGHFYKLHPVTFDILRDTDGIPLQIRIPNVAHELMALKESISMSQGLKMLLGQIDDIINKPKDEPMDPDTIEASYEDLFKKKPVE